MTMIVRLSFVTMLLVPLAVVADEPKPPMLTPQEQKRELEARTINDEGVNLFQSGQPAEAIAKLRRSLEIRRELFPASKYPSGHADLATSFNNLGVVLQYIGRLDQALACFRQGLEMTQKLFPIATFPDGNSDLATGLNNMGGVLQAMGLLEQALPLFRQSYDMRSKLFPLAKHTNGHPELALGLMNLGSVLQAMGQSEQALPLFRQAVEMMQKLFLPPEFADGHPNLANALNTTGAVLHSMGRPEQALTFFRQGLEMRQRLFPSAKFPNGHPHLATSLNNMGYALDSLGQTEQALPLFRQGLEMRRKLFRGVHPDLVQSLQNMGFALQAVGQAEEALPYYRQAVEMSQTIFPAAIYPDGHPHLVRTLNNLGGVLEAIGQTDAARDYYRQSLLMQHRLIQRELGTASEEAAFDKIGGEAPYINTYLSATHALESAGDSTYDVIWASRAMVTRLLEQRLTDARAAGSDAGVQLNRLRGLRRRTDQLLQDRRMKVEERDQLLAVLANERDQLERDLVARFPAVKRWQERDQPVPTDLVKALPPGSVFVDVIRYTRLEYVNKAKRKGSPAYAVFVLAKDRPVRRIELSDAKAIDAAVRQWRTDIDVGREAPDAVAALHRLLWLPIANALPPGATTIYVAPDGDLARLPWAALPIAKDRVLLEDFALAQVPHGTFLLDRLKSSKKMEGIPSLFTLGNVNYGAGGWSALPGTKLEVEAISAIAPGERYVASGAEATAARLRELLPKARFLHFATHGEFRADDFNAEKKRAAKVVETRSPGEATRPIASKNPLGYVGLVLAEGEILSGLGIVDLPLENAQLVTLSACDTGLGEFTGGEGVQGLQRAFHLAGCPNVVASLWKVNDAATAALMAKFYHEMWVEKKSPLTALRSAQLFIYRHPELIADLAGERGAPKQSEALAAKTTGTSPVARKTADTKLWAAFVLSGVGQ